MSSLHLNFPNVSVVEAKMQGRAGEECCIVKAKGSWYWQMYVKHAKPYHTNPFYFLSSAPCPS